MSEPVYNFCQVSLKNNIPIIIENYLKLKNLYKKIKIYVICPKSEVYHFKEKLIFNEIIIIPEEEIISLFEFKNIFQKISKNISYKKNFILRINWYYQQVLKLSFILYFIKVKKENIIIWDADTLILKKLDFFNKNQSIYYGTFNEFHHQYFQTNKEITNKETEFHISFLTQFSSITVNEGETILRLLKFDKIEVNKIAISLSKLILKSIFEAHKTYNGSMFSEYELIGQINYQYNLKKQIPILTLRFGLNGKLTNIQKNIARFLGFKHVTYENNHYKKENQGMLERNQSSIKFLLLILKNLVKFYFKNIKFNFIFDKTFKKVLKRDG